MKKALLYLLLFAYTTFVCKPLLPFITDTIAHIFWYSEHVATVHYENGKYHVHLETQQAAKTNLPQKEGNLPKSSLTISDHLNNLYSYNFYIAEALQTYPSILLTALPNTQLKNNFPPPRNLYI